MSQEEKALRLKIYVGELDQFEGLPAYKAVVHYLREQGVRGATVTKGVYGYGKRSMVHATSPLRLSTDLPLIIDVVDSEEKIRSVFPQLTKIVKGGLITFEYVIIVKD